MLNILDHMYTDDQLYIQPQSNSNYHFKLQLFLLCRYLQALHIGNS